MAAQPGWQLTGAHGCFHHDGRKSEVTRNDLTNDSIQLNKKSEKIKKNKKKVNSYRDAKDATSAHEKILADPTLPGTIGNFRSKGFFFRDALHLAHPARSSTFFSEKKERKTSLRDGTTRCKIHPG